MATPEPWASAPRYKPPANRKPNNSRPGKFTNLHDFAGPEPLTSPDSASESIPVEYKATAARGLFVRHIIHIKDVDKTSRIHDRIMLVVRAESGQAFTCLTFCAHNDTELIHEDHCQDHAQLISHAEKEAAHREDSQYFKLCIRLKYGDRQMKPQKNAYINLRELWHIESSDGVEFAVLGQACPASWPQALDKIIQVFALSIRNNPHRLSSGEESSATFLNLSPKSTNEAEGRVETVQRAAPGRKKSIATAENPDNADSHDNDGPTIRTKSTRTRETGGIFGRKKSSSGVTEDDKRRHKSHRTEKPRNRSRDRDRDRG